MFLLFFPSIIGLYINTFRTFIMYRNINDIEVCPSYQSRKGNFHPKREKREKKGRNSGIRRSSPIGLAARDMISIEHYQIIHIFAS